MSKSVIIGAVIILVVLAGGGYWLMHKPYKPAAATNTTSSSSNQSSSSSTQAAATITYSDSGFSPSLTTVKAGDTVAIKNTASDDVQFQSDPHPVHTDDPDLNVGLVSSGQTKTFVVTKTGTFGFHNHLNPTEKGRITIQ